MARSTVTVEDRTINTYQIFVRDGIRVSMSDSRNPEAELNMLVPHDRRNEISPLVTSILMSWLRGTSIGPAASFDINVYVNRFVRIGMEHGRDIPTFKVGQSVVTRPRVIPYLQGRYKVVPPLMATIVDDLNNRRMHIIEFTNQMGMQCRSAVYPEDMIPTQELATL